jgi:FSR family fosmidomycin resistance protein-like MFS transporter
MRLLRDFPFLAVSFGHFVVDGLNALPALLLAVFSVPFGLTNTAVGLLATIYGIGGALLQPVFGLASDRFGGKWLSVGGLLWLGGFFALVSVAPGETALVFLLLAGLGSAAFHPAATMDAADLGRHNLAGKAATGAALFFLFGQIGGAFGPATGGALVDRAGTAGILLLASLCLPAALLTIFARRGQEPWSSKRLERVEEPVQAAAFHSLLRLEFLLIVVMAVLRFWVQASTQVFLPKMLMEQGLSSTSYGMLAGLFMLGAAVGGIAGGVLGDWIGSFPIVLGATALCVIPFYLLPTAFGPLLPVLIVAAGVLCVAPHSLQVTMAQNALPGRSGLASGTILGSMFTLGGIGVFLTGMAADKVGLTTVLQANALLCALGVAIGGVLWSVASRGKRQILTGGGAWRPVHEADRLSPDGTARPGGA